MSTLRFADCSYLMSWMTLVYSLAAVCLKHNLCSKRLVPKFGSACCQISVAGGRISSKFIVYALRQALRLRRVANSPSSCVVLNLQLTCFVKSLTQHFTCCIAHCVSTVLLSSLPSNGRQISHTLIANGHMPRAIKRSMNVRYV